MRHEAHGYKPNEQHALTKRIHRRDFMKAAAGGILASSTYIAHQEKPKPRQEVKEWNPKISKHLVMIDFAPGDFSPDFIQWMYMSDDDLLSRELGVDYLGPINRVVTGASYMGFNWLSDHIAPADYIFDRFGFDGTMEQQFLRNNPHYAIASTALSEVGDHGEGVNHVMWQTINHLKQNNTGITPRIYPIQKTMNIDFVEDEIGNFTLVAHVDPEKVSEALRHYPNQDIVNFSWQAGDVRFTVHVNTINPDETVEPLAEPEITKRGAYRKEAAVDNLRELFMICHDHPEKLFLTALGNLGDDIREAREILAQEWPDNVLIIGEWLDGGGEETGRPNYDSYGADIYVPNRIGEVTFAHGSSFSTAILSSTAAYLREVGYTAFEIRDIMLSELSDSRFYPTDNPSAKHMHSPFETANVFNEQKLTTFFSHRAV